MFGNMLTLGVILVYKSKILSNNVVSNFLHNFELPVL